MFLTEVLLNSNNPLACKDLASIYELHRTLSGGFPDGERPRLLFRQESTTPRVLLLSRARPVYEKCLVTGRMLFARTKIFRPSVAAGRQLRFKLRANPTKKNRDGKRLAIIEAGDQLAWLAEKGAKHGFRLLSVHIAEQRTVKTAPGDSRLMTHLAVDFHGVLEASESDPFGETLESGVGSAKAFGFGMLCVAP